DLLGFHLRTPGLARALLGATQNQVATVGAGNRAADEQQVFLAVDLHDDQVLHRLAHVAHVTRHALALVHAARRQAAANRSAVAEELVRAVRRAEARHAVPLHDALIAFALGGAFDVDEIALLEQLGEIDRLARLVNSVGVFRVDADLAQEPLRPHAALAVPARGGLGDVGDVLVADLARVVEAQLHCDVAVLVGRALTDDQAGTGLDDGDGDGEAIFGENLGHPELAAQDATTKCARGRHVRAPETGKET